MGLTVYVCLDDRNGMLFGGRRQSRDRTVLEDIRGELTGPLLIDPFSERLIQASGIPYRLVEGPLPAEGCFFLEARPALEAASAERIVIYRWGRLYPSDIRWDLSLEDHGFVLERFAEFPGKSHELIRKEVYVR